MQRYAENILYATAELWHYLGLEFIPVAYSWPAGHGGLLRRYTYDRESSEFTVFHFKRFLEWLAKLPEVEGIHVIVHSRDVLIQYEGRSGGPHGYSYFRANPAVASDLVLTVRYGRSPGAETGRPLGHVEGLFWRIDDDYLKSLNGK